MRYLQQKIAQLYQDKTYNLNYTNLKDEYIHR